MTELEGIWLYQGAAPVVLSEEMWADRCIYCQSQLMELPEKIVHSDDDEEELIAAASCPHCGWWKLLNLVVFGPNADYEESDAALQGTGRSGMHLLNGSAGQLHDFHLPDISSSLQEVRNYIVAHYHKRLQIHPRVFEETVASVFRDLGYHSRVTAYSGDEGIDVVLDGPEDETIGIQVKRYKNAIKVEQIRSLAGALLLKGHTSGVFVTTSSFQRGAHRAAEAAAVKGKPIELYDAKRFLGALGIAQRKRWQGGVRSVDEILSICSKKLLTPLGRESGIAGN